ncbi:MAG TPA: DUF2147 domain-containing protein [Hyphomicrobiaceae bacterium]|jgi:uncharacterized protein (DUF2147 family)|nr:DUF2147 domain-containing protein [Hyphomicrobiaceae bacterium]
MIAHIKRAIAPLAISLAAAATPAMAASSPYGVWIDHTGRGAVEITDCGGKLCGRLVWFQDAKNNEDGCNFQIIGNVKQVAANKWDNGWIVDPDKDPNKKYDVEITAVSDQKLKVMGYAGMKFLSETMMWTRAPADLKKCGDDVARAPDAAAPTPGPAPETGKDAPAATTPEATPPAAAEEAKPAPAKTAGKGKKKDCKMDVGFAVITFPCPD